MKIRKRISRIPEFPAGKFFAVIFVGFFLIVFFSSCTAIINGVVREGGAGEINLETSLEPRTVGLMRSIRNFAGDATDAPVLDGPAISRSMTEAPGIRSVSLSNTSPSALEGFISISALGDFMAVAGSQNRFITYTEGRAAGSSSIIIELNMDSAPVIISMLSPDVEDYLSAFMAPAATGEILTRPEYLNLVAAFYGRPVADEFAAARIRAFIEFPRPPTLVQGGNVSGRQAIFDIPLVDLLVLETPLRYEVYW